MAALVVPGAPVTVLMDHGMSEAVAEKLMAAGVGTVEKLGAMTPEQLEEIPGVDDEMVNNIQTAVVGYYGQFEEQTTLETAVLETALIEIAETETTAEIISPDVPETDLEASNVKAAENESDTIDSTEVPAAAPDSGKGEAEIS